MRRCKSARNKGRDSELILTRARVAEKGRALHLFLLGLQIMAKLLNSLTEVSVLFVSVTDSLDEVIQLLPLPLEAGHDMFLDWGRGSIHGKHE